ncbi:helix-turn-helix domain-containing protein [Sphingobium phenoxybenzoativorans]|uniref:Helix-turn-helix domain-containing protein n=1 Tax=Sphingobium phenoxybenzoativorans TaxID=1592790 RepID=A0A975K9B8_9SPHN|nr:helix-turn-helix domain-containing protein [Sphingobium phenoxybenzoativorans]QUT07199.1 helix-turn-helix domain-containing protein [Sphingobium phenoxybenzoativorans]
MLAHHFSTRRIQADRRLEAWNERACQAFTSCTVDAEKDYLASLRSLSLGSIQIAASAGDAARMSVRPFRDHLDKCTLIAQRSMESVGKVDDRSVHINAGQLMLVDLSMAFHLDSPADKEIVCLCFNRSEFQSRALDVEASIGRPVSLCSGAGAMFAALLDSIWRNASESDGALLGDTLLNLAALALEKEIGYSSSSGRILEKAKEEIARRFREPELKTASVAASLGISERYLQQLFASAGTTPGIYIRDRRLESIAATLSRNAHRGNIAQLAFDAGFNDLSQFGRAFRMRYGMTPSQFRLRHS